MEKIYVISSTTCGYCVALMDYLDGLGVEYEEVNVGYADGMKRAYELVGQIDGVPVFVLGDTKIVGFDRQAINEILKEKGFIK